MGPLISGTVSKRGNKYAEIFATDFGWARAYPMKRKGEAHEALSLLFQRTGVPDNLIVDGSKEQVQGGEDVFGGWLSFEANGAILSVAECCGGIDQRTQAWSREEDDQVG